MTFVTTINRRPDNGKYFDFVLSAERNGDAIGKATIKILEDRPHIARLYNVWINEFYRDQGIASNWLPLLMDYMTAVMNVRVIRAKVERSNGSAVSVYLRLGFNFRDYNDDKYKISLRTRDTARDKRSNQHMRSLIHRTAEYNVETYATHSRDFFLQLYSGQLGPIEVEIQEAMRQRELERRRMEEEYRRRNTAPNTPSIGDMAESVRRVEAMYTWTPPEIEITVPASYFTYADDDNDEELLSFQPRRRFSVGSTPSFGSGDQPIVPEKPKEPRLPDMFDGVPTYEKFKFAGTAHAMLTPMGVEEVRRWVSNNFGYDMTYTQINDWVGLEQTLQKHYFEMRGDEIQASGRFSKRLSKVMETAWRVKLDDAHQASLNELLEHYWHGGDSDWYWDIVDKVDWEAGGFGEKSGDGGSCWWFNGGLDNPRSRVSLFSAAMPEEALGLRLWTKDKSGEFIGVGRCWVYRTQPGYPILFNSYGFASPLVWAAKLQKHFGFERYSKVNFRLDALRGKVDLLVNNRLGVLIGHPEDHKQFNYEIIL